MLVELPFEFVNDTPADADEVNANFNTVVNALNSHLQEINPHGVTPQQIGAAPAEHKHSANDIDSGTVSVDRLPKASTAGEGIVKLTTDRNSPSTELALAAKALYDHLTSNDHDDRYYTKAQIDDRYYTKSQTDQLLVPVTTWYTPSNTPLISALNERKVEHSFDISADMWLPALVFSVPHPGRYRVVGEFKGTNATLYDTAANPYDVGLRAGVRISVAPGVPVSTSIVSQKGRSAWGNSEWVPFELDMEIPTRTGLVVLEGLCSYDEYESYPDAEPGGVFHEKEYGATWVRNIVLRGTQTSPDSEQPFEVIGFI